MSNRRKARPGFPGNSARARAAFPAYVTPAALCDVPECGRNVAGSRTITLVPKDRTAGNLSVLIRLCMGHVTAPYDELLSLLPKLAELNDAAGPTAYLGPDAQ
jgi:hypothetical protein